MLSTAMADGANGANGAPGAPRAPGAAGALSWAPEGSEPSSAAHRALDALPDAVERTLSLSTAATIDAAAEHLGKTERMLVLGRGFHFATAFELALKIKETTGAAADPYATPDLLHGPLAMVAPGYPAVVVAHSGAAFADAGGMRRDLHARGARTVTITDEPSLTAATPEPVVLLP